jgi:hypothetical protein
MSNNPLHHPLFQGIMKSNRSKSAPESIQQPMPEPSVVTVKCYISLKIYQAESLQNGTYPAPVECLEAGQHYRILLQCSMDRIDANQQEVTINGSFRLYLRYKVVNGGICPFAIPQDPLHFEQPFAHPIEIPLLLPQEDCPTCSVIFSTEFVSGENTYGPMANSHTLEVQGNCTPENAAWLATHYLSMGVPKNTLVLTADTINTSSVKPAKECQVTLYNHYSKKGLFSTSLNTSQLINIADSMKGGGDPITILQRLREFSLFSAGKIMHWIKMVQAEVTKRGKQLALVIFDTTPFEIPWELLEIDYDQYIGAIAQVARWLHLEAWGEPRYLAIADYICGGSVLSYLDRGLEGTGEERTLLQTFLHHEVFSLEELQERLEEPLQDMGLLYIGSHGGDGTHLYTSMLSEDPQPPLGSLSASWLVGMRRQLDPRPILFINACESARILYKRDTRAYTLVKTFLLLCASNYIGTIAKVDSAEAPRIAKRLLELAWEDEGVQIVELLRRLRAETVERKLLAGRNLDGQQEVVDKNQQKRNAAAQLLNIFSYVYYGNPLARLRLRPAQNIQEGA